MNNRLHFFHTLKGKWTIVSAAIMFLMYTLSSIILAFAVQNWLFEQEKQNVKQTMLEAIDFFESQGPVLTIQDIQSNRGLISTLIDRDDTLRMLNKDRIEILRINNSIDFQSLEKMELPKEGFQFIETTNSDDQLTSVGVIRLGTFQGYLQLEHPLTKFHQLMKYIWLTLSFIGFITLGLSSISGYMLASRFIKPIDELKNSMKDVTTHGFQFNDSNRIETLSERHDEIGELIRMYEQMMDALLQSYEQQAQFVADASHELRTPIQVLEGHLSMLERWGKNDQEILDESIHTALIEVRRMKKLMEELLFLAKSEDSERETILSVQQETQDIVDQFEERYPNVTFQLKSIVDDVFISISKQAYYQIIRNLMENGIRYNADPINIEIEISIESNQYVNISILDNGIGIDLQDQEKIFRRFFRGDRARHREKDGAGLGLTIVKLLIEKYGGTIRVKSQLNEGTTFVIAFPMKTNEKIKDFS